MNHTTSHVAALIATMFEVTAAELRARGESAHAHLTDPDADEPLVSLEVDRKGGDWQRNLIVSFEPAAAGALVEVRLADEEQATLVTVGQAEVAPQELGEVALALARAGTTRLLAEVSPAAAVA